MIKEPDLVILTRDIEEFGLGEGDVGTVVHAYLNGEAHEVEFMSAEGTTIAVLTLTASDIRPMSE